ncbi:hypothetical protein V6Z11_D12G048800 [Gossypium hirsutum]
MLLVEKAPTTHISFLFRSSCSNILKTHMKVTKILNCQMESQSFKPELKPR